jgi:arabinogalactan oligomer / maltooligosaccharide transport system permease protein
MTSKISAVQPPPIEADMPSGSNDSLFGLITRTLGLAAFNALALTFIYAFLRDDNLNLAAVFFIITLLANIVIFVPRLWPLRWIAPGLLLAILFVIYPIVYTVVTGFSNYGDGHMLTKAQTITLLGRQQFIPEDAQTYSWSVYQNSAGSFALWLSTTDTTGSPVVAFAPVGAAIVEVANPPTEPPSEYAGYRLLTRAEQTRSLSALQSAVFGVDNDTAAILSSRQAARPLVQRYVYDAATNSLLDQETNTRYLADDMQGLFIPEGGAAEDALTPGYRVNIGLANFQRLFANPALLTPLLDISVWTVTYAILAVVISFAFGLLMAIVLDSPFIPFAKFWRSLIFIPYAIPAVISILIWGGLLNQTVGIVTNAIADLTGYRIPWFADPWAAKIAVLLVDLWIGYPYMMLVCSGALKAIPSEMYEAAAVDGAKPWHSFWKITLPMLLISVGPLLIASFTFTFNNYLLIELLTKGNPPMPGITASAGYTDILISYTYNLAFGANADFGYASAITLIIFVVMVVIALFNYRFVARWERISENV